VTEVPILRERARVRVRVRVLLVAAITAVAVLLVGTMGPVAPARADDVISNQQMGAIDDLAVQLQKLMDIPDSALTSDDALSEYVNANPALAALKVEGQLMHPLSAWDTVKCVAAIALVIGSTLLVAAKVAKIKSYIAALGGIRQSASLLLRASTWAERMHYWGAALVALAAELSGVAAVREACGW
jgi:hypothetical protein